MTVFEQLLAIRKKRGAAYLVLIDPDKQDVNQAVKMAQTCESADVDALLIGGSLLLANVFNETVKAIKEQCSLPIILFPGSITQVSKYADAILFLSVISGRNPELLIGGQVIAAPMIKSVNLETISTGYMFIESGTVTSALFMSDTRPIPREKPDIAAAHAITLHGCCVPGMPRSRCIDGGLLAHLHPAGEPCATARAKGQRELCGCTESYDVGWYEPCRHGCVYCYANPMVEWPNHAPG